MIRDRSRILPLLIWLGGCSAPVAVDLSEADANRIVVALEDRGIPARKERDPAGDGRFAVEVQRSLSNRTRYTPALRERRSRSTLPFRAATSSCRVTTRPAASNTRTVAGPATGRA